MTCDRVADALRARQQDPASGEAGAGLLAHLDACPSCRRAAILADPSLLFAMAAAAVRAERGSVPIPEDSVSEEAASEFWRAASRGGAEGDATDAPEPDWTGFNERVRSAILEENRRSGALGRVLDLGVLAPRRLAAAAAVAAVLAIATVTGWQGWRSTRAPAPLVADGQAGRPSGRVVPEVVSAPPGLPPAMAPAALSAPPPVEGVDSPTARVVHLALGGTAPGGPGADPAEEFEPSDVVLILDETMDL